ncbi:RNA polymerase sigma factor [Agrococcus sp. Marseille-P2731]|uniref:RNA polymerase sigma factor n=1 Tax=Agrococcus sp. Marseille-P2731 TaxID=1841862 RepID=UPI0009311BF1|nr:sigma-70 family RNA polymerase sigma factor [Agrococcus sp. Marseille-P2731]
MARDDSSQTDSARRAVVAVWRIESARIVATLTRFTRDFALAEDVAQDALADALAQWPAQGVPRNGAAWLTAVAKRKAIDGWRRQERFAERLEAMGQDLEREQATAGDAVPWDPDEVDDDVLRLVFTACHPVLSPQARVALTLRVVGGLESAEIARLFFVPVATIQQRIVRAKQALADARVPFETPPRAEREQRIGAVLAVLYLIFTEGHAATAGDDWMRPELSREAIRLARILAALQPDEPEVHGLLALLELTAARFPARVDERGEPVLLADQDRRRWDRGAIRRGRAALRRAEGFGRGLGPYALQAVIAETHADAPDLASTDWERIIAAYDGLAQIAPSPIVALNRAVAVSMAAGEGRGPAAALAIVDALAGERSLAVGHLLPSVRGELLARLGRDAEASAAFALAAARTGNARERAVLLARAAAGR